MADIESLEERRQRARKLQSLPIGSDERDALRFLPPVNPTLFGKEPGQWVPEHNGMPPHSPVQPLGADEDGCYFLSARGTITQLPANIGKGHIDLLFAPYGNFPVWAWPRFEGKGKERSVKGNYQAEEARKTLFAAAADAGPWDPLEQVRGRGAWLDGEGRYIYHLGDRLLTPDGVRPPGIYGEHVYPGRPAVAAPADIAAVEAYEHGPGHELFNHLVTWRWGRSLVDAMLFQGWLGCAMNGGALRWRPFVFLTGDQGVGKSTLIELAVSVLGEGGLVRSEDATEAGIAQTLGFDALPVLLDEMENEQDPRRAENVVKMARRAASGSQRIRGGQDHKSASFTIRSCFCFAAINMPTMGDQDMARMAMLHLDPFPSGTKRRRFDKAELATLGRAIHAQVIEWSSTREPQGVSRWDVLLDMFRDGLIETGGHNDRGADTFGFLMAGYWATTHREYPTPEDVAQLVEPLKRSELSEYEAIMPSWKKCWNFLMASQPRQLEKTSHTSVGSILRAWRDNREMDTERAKRLLEKVGLSVKWSQGARGVRDYENAWLFVPLSDPALASLFERTADWRASSAAANGQWTGALRGGPPEIIEKRAQMRMGGPDPRRGTAIRIAELVGYPKGSAGYVAEHSADE